MIASFVCNHMCFSIQQTQRVLQTFALNISLHVLEQFKLILISMITYKSLDWI